MNKAQTHGDDTPEDCQERKPESWGSFLEDEIARQLAELDQPRV